MLISDCDRALTEILCIRGSVTAFIIGGSAMHGIHPPRHEILETCCKNRYAITIGGHKMLDDSYSIDIFNSLTITLLACDTAR